MDHMVKAYNSCHPISDFNLRDCSGSRRLCDHDVAITEVTSKKDADGWQAFFQLVRRLRWNRVWIVQDVVMAREDF